MDSLLLATKGCRCSIVIIIVNCFIRFSTQIERQCNGRRLRRAEVLLWSYFHSFHCYYLCKLVLVVLFVWPIALHSTIDSPGKGPRVLVEVQMTVLIKPNSSVNHFLVLYWKPVLVSFRRPGHFFRMGSYQEFHTWAPKNCFQFPKVLTSTALWPTPVL